MNSIHITKLFLSVPRRRERRGGEDALTQIVAEGKWGRVEWATDRNGNMPARSYYSDLPDSDKAKILALFNFLRFLQNREKLKKLGSKAKGKDSELWEFKSFQHRFLGDYRPHSRFIIARALQKKSDNLPTSDIARAIRILPENDQREEGMP